MPLLIPGLDESAAKTLTKRLHKSLKKHEGVPSLTQLQRLMAQAIGHADWYAAQAFWSGSSIVSQLSAKSKALEGSQKKLAAQIEDLKASFVELLGYVKNGSRSSRSDLKHCIQMLGRLAQGQRLFYEEGLLERASEILDKLEHESPFQDPLDFERVDRLFQKACLGFYSILFPGQVLPQLPIASLGIIDEELFAPAVDEQKYEQENEEARRAWEEEEHRAWAEEVAQERAITRPVFEAAATAAMAAFIKAKAGDESAWEDVIKHAQSLEEYHIWPERLRIEKVIGLASGMPEHGKERSDRIERIENHLRRACAGLMEYFGRVPADDFPSAVAEITRGACLKGDWSLLEKAIKQSQEQHHIFASRNYENTPAVLGLCQWWNENAPKNSRDAGCFLVGVLSGEQVSYLGYDECPAAFPEDFAKSSNYAVFQSPLGFTYIVHFLRGQAHNEIGDGWGRVFEADGTLLWEVGNTEINESFYSIEGLHDLQSDVETRIGA